jgi:hypothetical protein
MLEYLMNVSTKQQVLYSSFNRFPYLPSSLSLCFIFSIPTTLQLLVFDHSVNQEKNYVCEFALVN